MPALQAQRASKATPRLCKSNYRDQRTSTRLPSSQGAGPARGLPALPKRPCARHTQPWGRTCEFPINRSPSLATPPLQPLAPAAPLHCTSPSHPSQAALLDGSGWRGTARGLRCASRRSRMPGQLAGSSRALDRAGGGAAASGGARGRRPALCACCWRRSRVTAPRVPQR